MVGRFDGRVVIVTGSSSGIGRGAILGFAKEGASVTLHGANTERLAETKKLLTEAGVPESRILVIQGPIEDENLQAKLIDDTVAKFGHLDVLVNNAGVLHKAGADPNSLENYDYVFSINVRAPLNLINLAAPHLAKTQGNIVNVSSIAAIRSQVSSAGGSIYGASKAALDVITKTKAERLAKDGVRVNSINPGPFVTNIISRSNPEGNPGGWDNASKDFANAIVPLKRFGNVDELTPTILLLADSTNTFTTGSIWVVDGGSLVGTALTI